MRPTRQLFRRPKGAATTEKMVVLLLGFMIIVPAVVLLGPILAEKVAFINEMLGGTTPTETLADRKPEPASSNTLLYVLGFGAVTGVFFITFVAPLLFPRARRTRQEIINDLAEKFEFLKPLADPDLNREQELAQMRGVANELRSRQPQNDGALEIQSSDYANLATPNEQTVTRNALDAPRPSWAREEQPPESLSLGDYPEDETTVDLEDGPMQRMPAPSEDETVMTPAPRSSPADASLMTSIPADQFPGRKVANPNERFSAPDSGRFSPPKTGPMQAQSVPNTGPIDKIDASNYEPDAETLARPALDRALLDRNRDDDVEMTHEYDPLGSTLKSKQHAPDDPDATTRPHSSFQHED